MSGIGEQRVNGSTCHCGPQLIHAHRLRQVCFYDGHLCAKTAEGLGGRLNFRSIRSDQQIKSLLRANRGQFESDARRSPGHNRKAGCRGRLRAW
jgi:hypothetical protein